MTDAVALTSPSGVRRHVYSDQEKRRILAEGRVGSRNVFAVCRRYGISRQTFYDWEETLGLAPVRRRFTPQERMQIVREARREHSRVQAVCREHRISRQTFYNWETRLAGTQDPSRLSDRRPSGNYRNLTPQWVVEKVLALRREASPTRSTPVRISQLLWEEHHFRLSPSGVFRILRRHGKSSLFRRGRRAATPAGNHPGLMQQF